ncbi:unnamed protein product, partial [Durusdinium trenchii]
HLLRGTALDDVLMYTVVPQPEDFQLTLPDPASMQIIIPSLITDHLFQILVVEHDFSGTQSRQALRFEVPITVRQVFQASGFGCLCDAETRCTLQYMHGNCQKVFSDEEDVLLPFASFVRIMVHWIPSLPCTPFRPLVASDVVARQVAAAVHPAETFSFDRAVRQAREVLAHAAGDDEEDDLSTLMQRLVPVEEAPKDESTNNSVYDVSPWMLGDNTVEMPSFAPWIEAVFVKRQLPNVSWNEIMEHLDTDIADEFSNVSLERPQDVPYVEIYTDGSFSKGKEKLASWAFVALCQVGAQKYTLGTDYGLVDPDPLSSAWTGAGSSTAREGENDALIRACEWSFAMGYEVPHYFYTDSTAAGYGASGASGTSVDDLQGRLSRSLAKALDAFLYMTE